MPPCWPEPKKNERTGPVPHRMKEKGGSAVDAIEWSASVYAAAATIAKNAQSREELVRLALMFTQLGTTLSTIAALQALDQNTTAGNTQATDLSTL